MKSIVSSALAAAFLLLAAAKSADASSQQVGVRGKVFCPSKKERAHNVKVFLVDKDIGFDDSLAKTKTAADGTFQLSGSAFDLAGNLDVQLKIYHKCGVHKIKGAFCERRLVYKIPSSYLTETTSGIDAIKYIDMGSINLEPEPKKEDTCNLTG